MSDTSPEKVENPLVSIVLVVLIALPCLLQVVVLRFFDAPGTGEIWTAIISGVTLICSVASAFGFTRLVRLRGIARLVAVVLLAAGLFAVSRFVTFWVSALLFMPRH